MNICQVGKEDPLCCHKKQAKEIVAESKEG